MVVVEQDKADGQGLMDRKEMMVEEERLEGSEETSGGRTFQTEGTRCAKGQDKRGAWSLLELWS